MSLNFSSLNSIASPKSRFTRTKPAYTKSFATPVAKLDLSTGLQGSGKCNDNIFRSSLRCELPSPKPSRLSFLEKSPSPVASFVIAPCYSARIEFPKKTSKASSQSLSKIDRASSPTVNIKAKENTSLNSLAMIPEPTVVKKTKTKVPQSRNILKAYSRRDNYSQQSMHCPSSKPVNSYHQSSLSTEHDSLTSVDINEHLRNIFRGDATKYDDENVLDFSIPEEEASINTEARRKINMVSIANKNFVKMGLKLY